MKTTVSRGTEKNTRKKNSVIYGMEEHKINIKVQRIKADKKTPGRMVKSVLGVDMNEEEMVRRLGKIEENKKDFNGPLLFALCSEMKEEIFRTLSKLRVPEQFCKA